MLFYIMSKLHSGEELRKDVKKIIKPSFDSFSETQAKSAITLLQSVAEDANNESTQQLLTDITSTVL